MGLCCFSSLVPDESKATSTESKSLKEGVQVESTASGIGQADGVFEREAVASDVVSVTAVEAVDSRTLAALSLCDKAVREVTANELQQRKQKAIAWAVTAKADWDTNGKQVVREEIWEGCDRDKNWDKPVNGHRGVFAYHFDDCRCSMGGWRCNRDGRIWSCCGSTSKNCFCPEAQKLLK